MSSEIQIKKIDYTNPKEANDLVSLMSAYARDPMGGGEDLKDEVKKNLSSELAKIPHAFSLIAYVDGKAAGLANCFENFSTFACAPLINIHDIIVLSEFRGLKLSQKLLAGVEEEAKARKCCKVTLEVLSNNEIAKNAYLKFGFKPYSLDPSAGEAVFWQKSI